MATVVDKTALTDPRVYGGHMGIGDPDGIILHHTGSKNEGGDEAWLSKYHTNPVSTNQLIKRNGTIIQIVPNTMVAYHAGVSELDGRRDCNAWCIGIEICNAGDGKEPYTDAQYEAVAQTVAYNCARFHIPDKHVATHAVVALPLGRKKDPKAFDLARMWTRIAEIRADWPFSIAVWFSNE